MSNRDDGDVDYAEANVDVDSSAESLDEEVYKSVVVPEAFDVSVDGPEKVSNPD